MTKTLAQKAVEVLRVLSQDSESNYCLARREWVSATEGKVFVRVNRRAFRDYGQGLVKVFDLASIEIKPKHRGKGVFREVLLAMEELAIEQGRALVVENVLNEHLEKALPGYGYRVVPGSEPPIFWKSIEDLQAQASHPKGVDLREKQPKADLPLLPTVTHTPRSRP